MSSAAEGVDATLLSAWQRWKMYLLWRLQLHPSRRARVWATKYNLADRFEGIGALPDGAAVVLATPAHQHAATAAVSLERGIDTLMKKPPGLGIGETRHLPDRAAASGA